MFCSSGCLWSVEYTHIQSIQNNKGMKIKTALKVLEESFIKYMNVKMVLKVVEESFIKCINVRHH